VSRILESKGKSEKREGSIFVNNTCLQANTALEILESKRKSDVINKIIIIYLKKKYYFSNILKKNIQHMNLILSIIKLFKNIYNIICISSIVTFIAKECDKKNVSASR